MHVLWTPLSTEYSNVCPQAVCNLHIVLTNNYKLEAARVCDKP